MLLTITISLFFLVAINFLLLICSCNKTTKRPSQKVKNTPTMVATKNSAIETNMSELAPTGS